MFLARASIPSRPNAAVRRIRVRRLSPALARLGQRRSKEIWAPSIAPLPASAVICPVDCSLHPSPLSRDGYAPARNLAAAAQEPTLSSSLLLLSDLGPCISFVALRC